MTTLTHARRRGRSRTSSTRDAGRAKNLFALGVLSWLYGRPTDVTERWIEQKFARTPGRRRRPTSRPSTPAGRSARRPSCSTSSTTSPPATDVAAGHLSQRQRHDRAVAGADRRQRAQRAAAGARQLPDHAGLRAAARALAPRQDRRHARSRPRTRSPPPGWRSGAAFGGRLGVTATSGPGMDLKAETIGLAVMLELPMIIIDVQRAGPSTGMPTKTEQSDLLMALLRPPRRVAAAGDRAEHAGRLLRRGVRGGADRDPLPHAGDPALGHLPGLLLGAVEDPGRRRPAGDRPGLRGRADGDGEPFLPYAATSGWRGRGRSRARPGSQHRIGGLEKADGTGNISYDGANHERMTELRAAQGRRDRRRDAAARRSTPSPDASLLVLGWGSSRGRDPGRRAARPGGRAAGGRRAPAPSESAAGQHRATCCGRSTGCWCPR